MNKTLLVIANLIAGCVITNHVLALQWPHPSSQLSSGYGYRIHPITHKPQWHDGIDIPGGGRLKAVTSGAIANIYSHPKAGNVIQFAGWEYLHLPDSGNDWKFGKDISKSKTPYFAIKINDDYIYYSTAGRLCISSACENKTAEELVNDPNTKPARTTITEGDFIAYAGSTGGSTGTHLHIRNKNGDPTKSPLIDLYNARKNDPDGYNPPENSQSPWILTPLFDSTTGIITAGISSASLGYPFEMDLNEFKIYTDNQLAHEIVFDPRKNAKDENVSGGAKTGFYPTPAAAGLFIYYKLPTHTCSSSWPSSIRIAAKDVGDKISEKTQAIYSYPPLNCPGGGHPDDNYSVSDLTSLSPDEEYTGDPVWIVPRIGILKDGFVPEMGNLLDSKKIRYTFQPTDISTLDLKNTDLVIIPSGGLHGLWNSDTFKKGLEDYVKAGGKILVFAQQHGYEYSALPTPDGKPVTAYGWDEDQNCFTNGTYFDHWHTVLSGQSRPTPTINVDGYFTGYPAESSILLRRTGNGQPAALIYPLGQGLVITTSIFTDVALGMGQASDEERSLARDIINWAQKPDTLTEIKPGDPIQIPLKITNNTETDAVSVKATIYDPDRKSVLKEEIMPLSLSVGSSTEIILSHATNVADPLGIYHVDYSLLDAQGETIYPHIELDAARFVVSNPPTAGTPQKDLWFAITSNSQEVMFGASFDYTFHVYNNTSQVRNLTIKTLLPHTNRTHEWQVTAKANGETTLSGSDLFLDTRWMYETLRAKLYDENNVEIGSYMLSFKGSYPSVTASTSSDKALYKRGENVTISVSLQNKQALATNASLKVRLTDPLNSSVFNTAVDINLPASGTSNQTFNIVLPGTAAGGNYTVLTEVVDTTGKKIGGDSSSFELPLSQVSVVPTLPAVLTNGNNTVSFTLSNSGKLAVSNGLLDINLKDADGLVVANLSQPFTLNVGESKTVVIPLSIPTLKFGTYTLSYTQSDETREGKPTSISLPNAVVIANSLDKASYRIRETAGLTVSMTNTGRFDLSGLAVTVSVPDAGFAETRTVTIGQGQALPLQYTVTLPETMTIGQHDVNVTLALPSGSSLVQTTKITIPQSLLTLGTVGNAHPTAGDTITIPVTNNGGVDTPVQYTLNLYDAKAALISEKSATETVQAGAALPLTLAIPSGAADGGYNLVVNYKDTKTIKTDIKTIPLSVAGVKAALTVNTDKQAYLTTESVSSLASLTNSGTPLQNGNLHLQVTTAGGSLKTKTWTSQYDFQQGIRNGVDTYGVNDWIIPDDDFSGTGVDGDKWTIYNDGSIHSGHLAINRTSVDSSTRSNWQLDGDFDVQVDFDSSISSSTGPEMGVSIGSSWVFISNISTGYESGSLIGGQWTTSHLGSYSQFGRLRIVRTGSTIVTYYFNNSSWVEVFRKTDPLLIGNASLVLRIWGDPTFGPKNAAFDNFKVNSGRIVTKNETVDSIRLLPVSDNFDQGSVSPDRWERLDIGGTAGSFSSSNGKMMIAVNNGVYGENVEVKNRGYLTGDFDIQIDWSDFVANAAGDGIGPELGIVTDMVNNQYKFSFIKFYKNRDGTFYQRGVEINRVWTQVDYIPSSATSGKLRLMRTDSTLRSYYHNGSNWIELGNGTNFGTDPIRPLMKIWMGANGTASARFDKFIVQNNKYVSSGKLKQRFDGGQTTTWKNLNFNSTTPLGASIKFRTRTSDTDTGLSSAAWSDYITASGSPVASPPGRWIEVEATLETTDTKITPLLHDVSVTYGNNPGDVLWQTDVPVSLAQNAVSDMTKAIGILGATGKLYLQGTLTSNTGQTIASSEYSFYVLKGNMALLASTDKKIYKPGEAVTVTGEVRNMAPVTASAVSLQLSANGQNIYNSTFDVPANSSHPFTFTTVAGAEGKVTLTGKVSQNNSTLVEITDLYEVAKPQVSVSVTGPDVAGRRPFDLNVEVKNAGKVDISGQWSVAGGQGNAIDNQQIAIKSGETKVMQYSQQITANTTYTFTLSGEVNQTLTKTVTYGEKATIQLGIGSSESGVKSEGKVAVPVTITNTGQVDEQLEVAYQLVGTYGDTPPQNQQTKTYYLPKGGNVADTLYYDLTKGSYLLSAVSAQPSASAQTSFTVARENDVAMTVNVGAYGNTPAVSVTVDLTNNGWNTVEGSVQLSVVSPSASSGRTVVWRGEQAVSLLTLNSSLLTAFNINTSAIAPGTYNLEAVLYNNSGQQLAASSQQLEIKGAIFQITQIPGYTTFTSGSEGSFTFNVKNTGNQEGEVSFNLKVMDVLDQTRREWLKPGEEKEFSFAFQLPEDLEEKDYFAEYKVGAYGNTPLQQSQVKFHVAGVNISVTVSLDKQDYKEGETAHLTLVVSPQSTVGSQNLFARVNYNGYEEQKVFTIGQGQAQPLQFDIPLTQITGEKLFYGIYHESGRSIHLNSLYVYKAGDAINISTDKQVYNPGETVTVTVGANIGSPVSGQMTLTGPGNYSETFAFSGSATKSITLPTVMTAGTYNISYELRVTSDEVYAGSHPIDVAGIQVKVKEATLDKAKYAATDTLNLNITIESNKDMAATLKTWVVDPSGKYTVTGEQNVNLSSSEPLLITHHSSLITASMGIHRLVYGIYADQLLLSSGSEAFDVGDAVILGMTADKADYSTITEPVNISFSLYGSTTATIDLYVDGQSVKSETVALSGFATKTVSLEPAAFSPGTHVIKAVLTAGGLTSVKETSIVYGSNLPDLTINVGAYGNMPAFSGKIQITATVMNMGKTASGATDVAFYDGDPVGAYGNTPLQTMPLPSIAPGESTTVIFDWNVMGKAGRHTIYAVADLSKTVAEFNESNNTATVDVEVPELILNVMTTSSTYEANQGVGIAETITNLTAGNTYSDAVLTTIIKDSAGSTITTLTNTIPAIAPGEASYANSWNTGSSRPGSYSINAVVMGQGPVLSGVEGSGVSVTATAAFDILPTVSAYGEMALSSNEVIQGFPMDISYTLTNNGNVEIGQAEVKVEATPLSSPLSKGGTWGVGTVPYLAVLASKTGSFAIEKVDAEPGEYTVSLVLTAGDKIINISSKDLTVKPPLKVTKSVSLLPRVLVWTHSSENNSPQSPLNLRGEAKGTNELIAIDALTKLGAYYRIVHTESEFIESMRSGYYNTYALLDTGKPTTDGLTSELVERVNRGDTLVLTGSSNMDDIKVSEVTGTKFTGYLPDGVRTATIGMPFYEQPVNITLSGKAQKATTTSATAYASGAIADIYPFVIVNSYGKGKGVLVAFDLGKSSDGANDMTTYSALFGRIIGNTAPIETRPIPEGVAPVEITVESIGSAFDLKVVEKADSRIAILDAALNGSIDSINSTVTWSTHIDSNQTVRYLYLSGLSQFGGTYATEAEVYYQNKGEYRLYNKYPLDIELAEGTAELQNNILNAINLLSVTKDKQGIRDGIVKRYMTLISRSSATRKDIDRDIHDLLKITEDLKKLSADTSEIREGLDKLLAIMQRRWAVAR